jgi:ABC-2 type transport system ATP-binding protein
MIKCNGIVKTFGNKNVLKEVSFEITEGQIFGLLGPSGAGKTTLIKILTDQLAFDSGEVEILGKDVWSLTGEDKKKIGIMMDQFGVYDRLSCTDNLKIYADIYGLPHSKVKKILSFVGLAGAEKLSASKLSKGMEARLRLARVFMHSPKIIFLDEPTSGLDPNSMRSIHKLILEKKKEGCTIFLTTHNMEEAAKLCDKVALLNEGEIVEVGTPTDICLKYNHKKKIILRFTSGEEMEVSHDASSAERICELLKENLLDAIHSSEPNLESVFLELTGRKLQEEA